MNARRRRCDLWPRQKNNDFAAPNESEEFCRDATVFQKNVVCVIYATLKWVCQSKMAQIVRAKEKTNSADAIKNRTREKWWASAWLN